MTPKHSLFKRWPRSDPRGMTEFGGTKENDLQFIMITFINTLGHS